MRKVLATAAIFGVLSQVASAETGEPADPGRTWRGWELGGQLSNYRFEEPDFGVKIQGPKAGVTGAYTFSGKRKLFFRMDGRLAYGSLDYEGSGTLDSIPNWIFEVRGVLGKDFLPGSRTSLSPFAGLGYRYLYNDFRGTTSTGAVGYQRFSRYLYLPLGLTARFKLGDSWVIAPTIEYDFFIKGEQVSQLSDTNLGFGDVTNSQDDGYGYRVSLMAEKGAWAFGPWMHYWKIERSDIVPVSSSIGFFEPKNETREFGFDVKYRF
ncbi:MAG: outer membrane beta-barrel protein [Burkholderiales bacterium]